MLIGALSVAFDIDSWPSLGINIVPLTIYIAICFKCKSETQIKAAQLLSVIYALVMMAVLVRANFRE